MATVVIAEAGVNHNGNIELAHQLIEAAASAGADIIKFQTFSAKDLSTADAPKAEYQRKSDGPGNQQDMLSKLQLSDEQHRELSNHCQERNIQFLSTAFGIPQLKLLLECGIGAIKVPSGEITHHDLLLEMAKAAKNYQLPVYLSTGMSNLGEVEAALQVFINEGIKRQNVTIMHCLSAYPAPTKEVNLRAIQTLKNALLCPVGYSDHTLGITAPIIAVSLGACVIEKHLTLDRGLEGPDHQASLEPDEFKKMVEAIQETEQLLGNGIKQPQPSEMNTRSVARRSIRAARFIASGTVIQLEDLTSLRPGDGLSPMHIHLIAGRVSGKDYQVGECISG